METPRRVSFFVSGSDRNAPSTQGNAAQHAQKIRYREMDTGKQNTLKTSNIATAGQDPTRRPASHRQQIRYRTPSRVKSAQDPKKSGFVLLCANFPNVDLQTDFFVIASG